MVVLRMPLNEVHLGLSRSAQLPLDIQVMPAASSWAAACDVGEEHRRRGAVASSTMAASVSQVTRLMASSGQEVPLEA